jgi:hypothetical protein
MIVEGTAGSSYDLSMGDEGYEDYVFHTNRGLFQVSVAKGIYRNGTPYYLIDQVIFLNELFWSNPVMPVPLLVVLTDTNP